MWLHAVFAGITLDKAFAEAVRNRWDVGCRYLIAVSGGRDSMVLFHFLRGTGYEDLVVCHVNHRMRGEASAEDAMFVQREAARFGCEAVSRTVDVMAFAAEKKLSLETAARELRYRAFSEMAEEKDCRQIFLAHHADDRVETVLINLFRGTGAKGLAGIEAQTTRSIHGVELTLIRPLLNIPQEEIVRYAAANSILYREDESNASDFALRNRVRNRLLPMLHEIFERDVRGAVLRAADLAALEEAWVMEALGDLPWKGDAGGLDVMRLRDMTEARRHRLLLTWLRAQGVPDCGFVEVARVAAVLMSSDKPAKSSLPGGFHVRRREGLLFIEPKAPA
jgi:tRNA(Ile)-lysidine synthase